MRSSTWFFSAILLKTPIALVDLSCFSSAIKSSGIGASGGVADFVVVDIGNGVFATGALIFAVARGGEGCVTGGFAVGATVLAGVEGGGTGAESGDETSAGGGLSVPRVHPWSPITTAAATRQIRVNRIRVTPSQPTIWRQNVRQA